MNKVDAIRGRGPMLMRESKRRSLAFGREIRETCNRAREEGVRCGEVEVDEEVDQARGGEEDRIYSAVRL